MNQDQLVANLTGQFRELLAEGEAVMNNDLLVFAEELAQRTVGALMENDTELLAQLKSVPEMLATASGIVLQRRTQERLQEGILWTVRALVGVLTKTP